MVLCAWHLHSYPWRPKVIVVVWERGHPLPFPLPLPPPPFFHNLAFIVPGRAGASARGNWFVTLQFSHRLLGFSGPKKTFIHLAQAVPRATSFLLYAFSALLLRVFGLPTMRAFLTSLPSPQFLFVLTVSRFPAVPRRKFTLEKRIQTRRDTR